MAVVSPPWTTATSQVGPSFGGPGWLAGETILAAPDYSARSRQTLATLFHDLVAQAGTCPPAGSAVSVTVDNGTEYAATASVASNSGPPITLHEYLAMPAGYIEWFGVWYDPDNANGLPGTWSGPPARTLLSELESGPCSVSRRCG